MNPELLQILGRYLARMHNVGAVKTAAHHEAKMRFVLTSAQAHLSDVEIVKHSMALGAVSEGLAAMIKAGMPLSPKHILDSLVEITKEV